MGLVVWQPTYGMTLVIADRPKLSEMPLGKVQAELGYAIQSNLSGWSGGGARPLTHLPPF
jgi:hypothetical protein